MRLAAVHRLFDPDCECHVHRQWFVDSAMDELLETDFTVAEKDRLYGRLDRVRRHKQDLFVWRSGADLFPAVCPQNLEGLAKSILPNCESRVRHPFVPEVRTPSARGRTNLTRRAGSLKDARAPGLALLPRLLDRGFLSGLFGGRFLR